MLLRLFFFFFLLFNLNLHLSSSSSISFPDFQNIDVLQPPLTVTGTLSDFNNTHFSDESNSKYTLRLLHRDSFSSVSYRNHHHRLHARMRRDTDRVAAILRRISGKVVSFDSKYEVDDFGSDVVSGMDQGSGEYFVRIGVGSPPRDQYMVIDSGIKLCDAKGSSNHEKQRKMKTYEVQEEEPADEDGDLTLNDIAFVTKAK